MAKKQPTKSQKSPDLPLTPDEAAELQLILDRLSVQSSNGESFTSWLHSLKRSLEGRENLIAALLQNLSRHPTDVGFRAFETLEGMVGEKRSLKVVKQAAYRFSQRGFNISVIDEASEHVVLVPPEARISMAHMAVGASGYLFLTALVSPSPTSYPVGVSAFFENHLTRLSIKSTAAAAKPYREFTQNVSGLFPFPLCEIPLWHAALIFREMITWAGGLPSTAEARQAEQLLRSYFEPGKPPYVCELMAPIENPKAEMLSLDVEPLFNLVPAKYLVFSKGEMAPLAQRIRDLEGSVLVLPPEMKIERAQASISSTIEELFAGELKERLKRLFEEMALWLKLSREDALARCAWIVAQHMEHSSSLGENRLLQQLVYLSLREYWPQEFRTSGASEAASQPYQETDSGLIVLK